MHHYQDTIQLTFPKHVAIVLEAKLTTHFLGVFLTSKKDLTTNRIGMIREEIIWSNRPLRGLTEYEKGKKMATSIRVDGGSRYPVE